MRIRISNYRHRRTGEDSQARCLEIGPVTVWFSYTTPVAFQVGASPRVVCENIWSKTTGCHLNAIDGGGSEAKKARVKHGDFETMLQERVGRYFYPRDLDADCPPGIVADWLEDRGLCDAARAIREPAA